MQITRDIQTHPAIGDRGLIDIYRPDEAPPGPLPFVLAVHGGGWARGDRTSIKWVAPLMAAQGWATVCCSYRVGSEAVFPAAYDDLVHLLAWLREHGPSLGLDADRAALFGGSAGGHLVSLLATRLPLTNPRFIHVRAVAAYCPILDTRVQFAHDVPPRGPMAANFLGGPPEALPQAYSDSSPVDHVHSGMPPVFLFHGQGDGVVPWETAPKFAQAIRQAGVEVVLKLEPGVPHTMINDRKTEDEPITLRYQAEVVELFKRHLS